MIADHPRELDAIASEIGLQLGWCQRDHYDLTTNKRRLAVEAGAIELEDKEFMAKLERRK